MEYSIAWFLLHSIMLLADDAHIRKPRYIAIGASLGRGDRQASSTNYLWSYSCSIRISPVRAHV